MLRLLAKKLSNFSTAANPPPPNEHMTLLVEKIDIRRLP
jgi:hypothetical protein